MTDMLLSVIMPMFNAAPFVDEAIASVLAQSYGAFRFLIVDDGSSDGSGDKAAEWAARDARITLLRQENQGIVTSLNRMLAMVETPFVARMDADDICLPERFERQLARMQAESDLGALGTQFVEINPDTTAELGALIPPVGRSAVHAMLQERQPIANPTAMFRTDALRQAGLYRQAFRYCEDYDLFLRLSQHAALDNLPDVLFRYRRSPEQMSIRNHGRQTRQAIFARLAHRERQAGRPDPFDGLDELPPIEALDTLLGRAGVGDEVQSDLASALRYSIAAMSDEDFAMFCAQAASGRRLVGGRRSVLRCLAHGKFARATRLSLALLAGYRRHWR